MRNFGKKSLDEIKERLALRGLIEAPVRDETEPSLDVDAGGPPPENGEDEPLDREEQSLDREEQPQDREEQP
jgi:hypothetical protein